MNVEHTRRPNTESPTGHEADTPPPEKRHRAVGVLLGDYAVVVFLLLLVLSFSIALPDLFPTARNAEAVLTDQAVPGMLALAVILPLSVGEFDLSVGAVLGFVSVFMAWSTSNGMAFEIALPLGLLIGAVVGGLNAFLVVKVRVSAFIATLGVGTVLSGGNLLLTDGAVLFEGVDPGLLDFARRDVLGIPLVFWYFLAGALMLWYLLEHTPYGRYLQATGLGRGASRLAGVPTDRYMASAFVLAGIIAAFAGIMQTGRVGSAPPTVGPEFLLPAYAAAFLGAATIKRGRFNVWGTVTGVFVLAVGVSGLALLGAPFWVNPVFNGLALLIAVSFAVIVSNRGREVGPSV